MSTRSLVKHASRFLAAAAGFCLLLALFSWLGRPRLAPEITARSPEEIAAVEALRRIEIDAKTPVVIHRAVNYAEGERAPWYPKGESPLLADLVRDGKLPPVAERVGPEPCVVEGVEGIGKFGGTWQQAVDSNIHMFVRINVCAVTLLRWSPQGLPLVPLVARSYTVSADNREFVFTLRRGICWSDGHPFTADDILYWWENECHNLEDAEVPPFMRVGKDEAKVEKLGDFEVKFTFSKPYGLFLSRLATYDGTLLLNSPAHYLRRYHPVLGDALLIERQRESRKLTTREAVYLDVKRDDNPEYPRLWPWIYRTYKPNPPQTFVRNPYFWMVDTQGNQLPYIDRLLIENKPMAMVGISAANGELPAQTHFIPNTPANYTLLMSNREKNGFEVYHWHPGDVSFFTININLNRRRDPNDPEAEYRYAVLNDKRFRQALSLAIDRKKIIDAEYFGQTEPAQAGPGRSSPFYNEELFHAFTRYDPERANRLLDEMGLTKRDYEGYRTFPDGSRMTFFLSAINTVAAGTCQFVLDDWAHVGVRCLLRIKSFNLFWQEKWALQQDFNVWAGGAFMPLLSPGTIVPVDYNCDYAIGYGRWFMAGGFYGDPKATPERGCIEPPPGHPIRRVMEIYERACAESDPARQKEIFNEALRIAGENLWTINICTPLPILMVVKNGVHNVPRRVVSFGAFLTPVNAGQETYYFENPSDSAGAIEQMKGEIIAPTLAAGESSTVEKPAAPQSGGAMGIVKSVVRWMVIGIAGLGLVLVSIRHPYIGRRILIMVPMLFVISIVVFVIIQLPPGDFISTRIRRFEESGAEANKARIAELKAMFHLEESQVSRYFRWLGAYWFVSYDKGEQEYVFFGGETHTKNQGLLQGNLGRSMETTGMVNDLVGDRILLTFLLSLGTVLFTWVVAIPIGIYSAVRQHSVGDYALTFIGFIGMCVPGFLLALLFMYVSSEWFGVPISGLFSPRYGAQPEWSWGKALDLLQHIWVPVLVIGVSGTAGMIRVMRANLLDELKKPYVITARAKGVRPLKLLWKYPVRLALNPFISGIGGLFPYLVSGGTIVSVVLTLPTVGPLMLDALMSEDTYLAGSMLMILSLLGVLGTLVSDLLLLWLDPRIRFTGGSR